MADVEVGMNATTAHRDRIATVAATGATVACALAWAMAVGLLSASASAPPPASVPGGLSVGPSAADLGAVAALLILVPVSILVYLAWDQPQRRARYAFGAVPVALVVCLVTVVALVVGPG